MKLRIIKRTDREKVSVEIPASNGGMKGVGADAAVAITVNSWIDDVRQKRAHEQRLVQLLFKEK